MTRSEFVKSSLAAGALMAFGSSAAAREREALQLEIDEVRPEDYLKYLRNEKPASLPALKRLDDAFARVLEEVRTVQAGDIPAVWLVYNMGLVVKTRASCFSVDLVHRRALELSALSDFALISHIHSDHYMESCYLAMNGAGKTVVSNFRDNYGTRGRNGAVGGYTRAEKTFVLGDVTVRTALTDHNDYLTDFTTTFEIQAGGFTIFHTGDCSNVGKLNPSRSPDLWVVHPYCGMNVADGVRKFKPKKTVIGHLNELAHPRERWRWTYQDGFKAKAAVEAAGAVAVVPDWGERLA